MKYVLLLLVIILVGCSSPEDKKKIKELEVEVLQLDSLKNELISENEELKERVMSFENIEAEANEKEKIRLDKLRQSSQGLVLDGKVQVVTVKTGFDPYHNSSDLFLPAISLMFKNISKTDINDFIKVRAVFIDNSNGEQIGEDYTYLSTSSKPFSVGTKKQITLKSSVGGSFVQKQNVSVKISIEDDAFKSFKIKNREYRGRI